jgi:hypothetical protein
MRLRSSPQTYLPLTLRSLTNRIGRGMVGMFKPISGCAESETANIRRMP